MTHQRLRLALAGLWLFDAVLQCQPFMFSGGFARMLAGTAAGSPPVAAAPVAWTAALVGRHPEAANAAFVLVQLLIGLAIAYRPTVKIGLAASVGWSLAVWWLGEGLGGMLAPGASAVVGAPGAVLLYALLAVLLWRGEQPQLVWFALWAGLALLTLRSAGTLHDSVAAMTPGEPGWVVAMDHAVAGTLAGWLPGAVLAVVLALIAAGIFLPDPHVPLLLAFAVAALIWVLGQDFGGILTGASTDPSSGPLLALLAAAYWPIRSRAAV